jgi:hypothetical protein
MNQPQARKAWHGTDWRRAMALAQAAPRCTARCKHSKAPCRNPAVKGRKVCRMHGGKGGAPRGERNGAYRHGRHTAEAKAERRALRKSIRLLWTLARLARDL